MAYKLSKGALVIITMAGLAGVTGCKTVQNTSPDQTALEQMLLARAADDAIGKIKPNIPRHNAIFINSDNFIQNEAYRTQYALARIRSRLLALDYRLVDSKDKADTIAEVSTGVLSIEQSDNMFAGLPSMPIPFSGNESETPEVPFFKKQQQIGVASFNLAFYDAETGQRQDVVGPIYGFSHYNKSAIFNIDWETQDLLNKQQKRAKDGKLLELGLPAD